MVLFVGMFPLSRTSYGTCTIFSGPGASVASLVKSKSKTITKSTTGASTPKSTPVPKSPPVPDKQSKPKKPKKSSSDSQSSKHQKDKTTSSIPLQEEQTICLDSISVDDDNYLPPPSGQQPSPLLAQSPSWGNTSAKVTVLPHYDCSSPSGCSVSECQSDSASIADLQPPHKWTGKVHHTLETGPTDVNAPLPQTSAGLLASHDSLSQYRHP